MIDKQMNNKRLINGFFLTVLAVMIIHCNSDRAPDTMTGQEDEIRLMTLNPGHFHAALVQKNTLKRLSDTVHIYSPGGLDLEMHMERIEGFNNRDENPTQWVSEIYTGEDYLERMIQEQPGNVMVTAGNNQKKTNYLLNAIGEGIHVLSDKPMAIDSRGWEILVNAFDLSRQNDVLLYDIMTERSEVTSRLLRILISEPGVFGELIQGSVDEPAIYKESVHHLYKQVAGSPLRRPPWYFDVGQQGEGIVDVAAHLVDLSMWTAFPDVVIDYRNDVNMIDAERWPTRLTRRQFESITGHAEFPDYLVDQLDEERVLPYYCNGRINYTLKDHHAEIMVQWDYEAPPGGDDSHYSVVRGTRSNLVVRQGEEQDFRAILYVEPVAVVDPESVRTELDDILERLQSDYPGAGYEPSEHGWKLNIPDRFHYGHEAHFGMVAERFFDYLQQGALPEWEVPNMITKYHITTQAREMARK